jgi:peptidoglycan/xylan/chitin deacetylase (PgdA/CDA1 family)
MPVYQKVPVLMYHSVGVPNPNWIWNFLTVPHKIFEDHLLVLKTKGFNTIDLPQLYDYVSVGKPIPPNSIVLTFDDGYLDNWVYAYPLLKKYGFKGTIFVNPEFVDPTEEYRPNFEDIWAGKVRLEELISHGFLSWREMIEMEKDGVMDIQSHGMTHTWYFTGSEIVDFRHPGDPYVWMNWNKNTNRKHKYLTENQDDLVELGTPVYQHGKSLEARRYYPDEYLDKALIHHVKENGGKEFFKNKSWREQLSRIVEDYKSANILEDGFESDLNQKNRFEWELKESKKILEKELKKNIRFFCWPGGGRNEFSIEISKKYYVASTISSRDQKKKKNRFGEDPSVIRRVGLPYSGVEKDHYPAQYLSGFYLFWTIRAFRGNIFHKYIPRILKFYYTSYLNSHRFFLRLMKNHF